MVWDSLIHGQEKRCLEWLFLTMMKTLCTVRHYHCTFVFVKLRLTRVDLNLFLVHCFVACHCFSNIFSFQFWNILFALRSHTNLPHISIHTKNDRFLPDESYC